MALVDLDGEGLEGTVEEDGNAEIKERTWDVQEVGTLPKAR